MFIPVYLTIIIVLFPHQIIGVEKVIGDDSRDSGWGLFLSVSQANDEYPSYDIGHWTRQLHLQQCVFVEIGEEFCALFVELRSIPSLEKIQDSSGVGEFFLGLCQCSTVRSWILCSDQLMRRRKSDCIFTEAVPTANTSARVHRRLCDVTLLTKYAQPCNCSIQMANQQLYRTEGFPTCFRSPLPESICSPRGVCGIARCCAKTIRGIHSPQCDPECHEKQPFCEEVGPWTSIPPEITSLWSHWSTPICKKNGGRVFSTATAICLNQVTRRPAIDCIGPGSFCCPADTERCTCIVTNENGILKATRIIESMPCMLSFKRDGAGYLKQDSGHNKNHEEIYDDESTLGESMKYQSYSEQEDVRNPWHRRLLFSSYGYSENQDHSFDEGVEFAGVEDTQVNEDEGSDKGDDKDDGKGDNKDDDKGDDKDDGKGDDKDNDKGDDKDDGKGDDKDDDKGDDKDDGKGDDKDDDKGDDKSDDKSVDDSDDKTEDKSDDKSGEKSDDKDDKGDEKNEDKRDESDDNESDDSGDNKANENADDESDDNADDNNDDDDDEDDDDVDEEISEEDANLDEDLEEDEEDSTESSEDSEYDAGTNDECEEEDSTSIKGPLIYSDYDPDSDTGDDEETSGEDYNEEASSLAVIGQTFSLYPFYYLSTYACIALFT